MMALVATFRSVPSRFISNRIFEASALSGSAESTFSCRLTSRRMLGFTSNATMESTAYVFWYPKKPPIPPTRRRQNAAIPMARPRIPGRLRGDSLVVAFVITKFLPFCCSQPERTESRTSGAVFCAALLSKRLISLFFIRPPPPKAACAAVSWRGDIWKEQCSAEAPETKRSRGTESRKPRAG